MHCNLHEQRPLTAAGMINGEKSPFKCPVKHVHETAVKCRGHLLACPAKIYTGMLGGIPTSHHSLYHFFMAHCQKLYCF